MEEIISYLMKLPLPIHIISICGKNKTLLNDVKKIKTNNKVSMHILGFVNDMEKLMAISDILVTKPGGLTITEALSRKVPLVIINPLPGQETKNTEFLLKNKVALKARNSRDVAKIVGDLGTNRQELNRLKNCINKIFKPDTSLKIADRIINWGNEGD